jgi:hypothetical protein
MSNRALSWMFAAIVYVCPMHPDVVSDAPGFCPKCHMKLDPKPQVADVRAPTTAEEWRWA